VKEVRSQLAAALAEKKNLESSVASLSAKDKSSSSAVKEKDDKIFQLSRELDSWHARLPPLIARFQARDADASALQEQLEAANHRISTLEAALDSDQTQFETIDSANLAEEYDASNDTLASTIGPASGEQFREALNGAASDYPRTHEPVTPDDSRREAESKASVTVADNLQDIKGVGPAIEKTLHQLGFFRFGQIAEMSEYDIDRVARHLKGFRSRIYREDWIGQARELRSRRAGGPV
jgi:predicted flap endonuclease-1-like 5' DNA nuclease